MVSRESANPAAERTGELKRLFPEAVSEGRIDFDKLRELLGDEVDDRPERYSFTWAGKRDAIRLLSVPSRATLVPDRDESVDFDATENLFIEGDNLEVLKLLYKSYFGRVKMIYIDPPYNTGNDFVYPDNYRDPLDTYLQLTGQRDADGNLLTSNPDTSGRYHSNWLSMMYPRLFLARQLLREDGVIFISIDDSELAHLKLLMDMVFGEEQFIGVFIWKSRHNVDSRDQTGISGDHEYIVCYGQRILGRQKDLTKYSNPDNDPRGPWMSDNLVGLATADQRPNLHYDLVNPATGINYGCPEKGWRYDKGTMARKIQEGRILWPSSPKGRPRHKKFLHDLESEYTGLSTILDAPNTSGGTQELRRLFSREVFPFPKPSDLLKILVQQGTAKNSQDLILDFFAGSATTAHAVLQLNREDGGDRRFIMVQLPEPLPKPIVLEDGCELRTIADIGRERIRRVIAKLKAEREGALDFSDPDSPEDLGFRAFRLDKSNFRQWEPPMDAHERESGQPARGDARPPGASVVDSTLEGERPREPNKAAGPETGVAVVLQQMELFHDPLRDGWTPENVIAEIALKEGLSLTARVEQVPEVADATVFRVMDADKGQSFLITLDDTVRLDALVSLDLTRDVLFICRDCALDDETAANLALQCRLKTI